MKSFRATLSDMAGCWARPHFNPRAALRAVFSYEEVAHFGGNDGVSERPLPLAGCGSRLASLAVRNFKIPRYRSVSRNASLRERSAPFEVPPDAD